jgi:hypothetical protein
MRCCHRGAAYGARVVAQTGYVMFLNGGYGVGKSAVLDHMGDLLHEAGRPFSLMDVDWFHRSWPPANDDRQNVLTEAANLAAVSANYVKAGPRQLVVCGVISEASDRSRYENALRLRVRSVRLEACAEVTAARLRLRYAESRGLSLRWHLERYEELAQQLRLIDLDESAVATDDLTPRAVAERVLEHFDRHPEAPGDASTSGARRTT